jgi:hypothetical protein
MPSLVYTVSMHSSVSNDNAVVVSICLYANYSHHSSEFFPRPGRKMLLQPSHCGRSTQDASILAVPRPPRICLLACCSCSSHPRADILVVVVSRSGLGSHTDQKGTRQDGHMHACMHGSMRLCSYDCERRRVAWRILTVESINI